MIYRLLHKKIGIKAPEIFSEFESSHPIHDMCYVDKLGFVYLDGDDIKLLKNKNSDLEFSPDKPIQSPMSLSYNAASNSIYVCGKNGIFEISLGRGCSVTEWIVSQAKEELMRYFRKSEFKGINIDSLGNKVAISSYAINRCFIMWDSELKVVIGNGHGQYCISSTLKDCSLNWPSDILIYDSNIFFVSDTNNGCIRKFGENNTLIAGYPNSGELMPTFMVMDRIKGFLYFLSKNYLNALYLKDRRNSILMENENLKALVLGKDNDLFALEENS